MFAALPNFGASFLYSIDHALQFFFSLVQDATSGHDLSGWEIAYPETQATELMDGIQGNRAPTSILLPVCLRTPTPTTPSPNERKRKADTNALTTRPSQATELINPHVETKWKLPQNMQYRQCFFPDSPNLKNWPSFDNKKGVKKPLCICFQALGRCSTKAQSVPSPTLSPPRCQPKTSQPSTPASHLFTASSNEAHGRLLSPNPSPRRPQTSGQPSSRSIELRPSGQPASWKQERPCPGRTTSCKNNCEATASPASCKNDCRATALPAS